MTKIPLFSSILTKIFNISPHEGGRAGKIIGLRFVYYLAHFLLWTISIAFFVDSFGITYLPLLYIVYAVASIVGSIFYSFFVYRVKRKYLMLFSLMVLAMIIVLSPFLLNSRIAFFGCLLSTLGIFMPQTDILLTRESEELFTPLESQRVVPLVEATEPIAGIFAGILLSFLVGKVHTETFLFIIGILLYVLLILYIFSFIFNKKHLHFAEEKEQHSTIVSFKRGIEHIKAIPFMRGITILVFLWILSLNMIDIHYTKTLEEMSLPLSTITEHIGTGALKDVLVERLGTFQILFSFLVLLMQLFLTGRIVRKIGLVKSFYIMPVVTLFCVLNSFFFSIPLFIVGTKASMEMFGGLFKTAYHNSYYSIMDHIREHIRELLEGIVRPIAIIVSTLIIFSIQFFVPHNNKDPFLLIIGCSLIAMLWISVRMKKTFTAVAKKNLEMSMDYALKSSAIEMLSQKGHTNASEILSKSLLYRKESPHIKIKILHALGEIGDTSSLPEILECLKDPSLDVKLQACQTLTQYKHLGAQLSNQVFSKHYMISTLSQLFTTEDSKRLRSAIIHVFSTLQHHDVVSFLLQTIEDSKDEEIIADCIYVIGLFGDINTWHYLSPYLTSKNPRIKANAIISLWQFKKYRLQLLIHLMALLDNKEENNILSGIYAVGEVNAIQEKQKILKYLSHEDLNVVRYAGIALAKMNEKECIPVLLSLLLEKDIDIAYRTKLALNDIHNTTSSQLSKQIHLRASYYIHMFMIEHSIHTHSLENLTTEILRQLMRYYAMMNSEKEVFYIHRILEKRMNTPSVDLFSFT